ncbi:hypothetical protein OQJ13_11675 [Legionella sp. PATHC035]|uniref:hypothetical protein n=1 Tax=Legionella sp. PATHC035 TaxID=2992040 RepID=UPI002243BACC|nr:hypothetical protein [Legionella sp. PATHC035]MCW8409630.1 hypothetical protein [Legionella sp. PATHC035]
MPRFFSGSKPTSTVHHNVQVSNSIIQILTTTVESYAPSVVIPGTVAQTIGSIYAVSHSDSHVSEKLLHVLQGLIALARFGLAIALMFDKQECDVSSQENKCIASFLLLLIYSGIVSVGLASSALSKDINSSQASHEEAEQQRLIQNV